MEATQHSPTIIVQVWQDKSGWRWNAPQQGLHGHGFDNRMQACLSAFETVDPNEGVVIHFEDI